MKQNLMLILIFILSLTTIYLVYDNNFANKNIEANINHLDESKEAEDTEIVIDKEEKAEEKQETKQEEKQETKKETAKIIKNKEYVAHAGGMINDQTYTNSKEAILNSYDNGFRLIEIDIDWTLDDVPVLIHGWDNFMKKLFNVPGKEYRYDEFKKLKMINDGTQLSLEDAMDILRDSKHKDMYYITDVKSENIRLLTYIKKNYKDLSDRIIPQVYSRTEYDLAKYLGYENIIYTLYLTPDNREQIIEFAILERPFAITMDTSWAYSDLPLELDKYDIYTYVHTLNKKEEYEYLKTNGIKGVYTDICINK